jgi:hypothetical protein
MSQARKELVDFDNILFYLIHASMNLDSSRCYILLDRYMRALCHVSPPLRGIQG